MEKGRVHSKLPRLPDISSFDFTTPPHLPLFPASAYKRDMPPTSLTHDKIYFKLKYNKTKTFYVAIVKLCKFISPSHRVGGKQTNVFSEF